MKLTFTTSLEDWLAFQKHWLKTSRHYRDAIFVWQWFFAILFGAIVAYVFSDMSREIGLGAGFLALVLTALVFPPAARWNSLANSRLELSKKKFLPLFAAERTLEICDEGLRSESGSGSQLLRWWMVESVDETTSHSGIAIALGSGFVIPKSSVHAEVLKAFLSELRDRLQKPATPHQD